jgi:alkylation response protein AidB-like acyl-CoA dehydrogenase
MELLAESPVPEHAREVKHRAREFADEHIRPAAAEYYASGEYPWEVLEAAMDAGLVGQDIPEEYGGQDYDIYQLLAMSEEFYRADAGIGLTLMLASFGAEIMAEHGTEEQKERFLRPVAENERITGLAVSEPDTGSDLAGMTTTAEKDGDEYVLNGEKYWVGNGVEADWVTLYAKTGDDPDDRYGNYSLLAVPTDVDGYDAEHIPEKMAMRASKQAHIRLDDARVPAENLIGAEGTGFYMLADFFNFGRVVVGGQGIGLAAAALEEAWSFVHDRESFGRGISEFQSVQHRLADMRIEFEAARGLVWQAAERVAEREDAGLWASMAKVKGTETATMCAENGMQLHGGRSILTENRIARVYRDCRVPVIYEGANEVQRNLVYSQQQ